MEKVTNYGWSKNHRPSTLYEDISVEKVLTEHGATMKLGDNLDISLLDEYSVYYVSGGSYSNGSPVFVVNDGMLYQACHWGEINKSTLKRDLFAKIKRHELTAYDALALLTI